MFKSTDNNKLLRSKYTVQIEFCNWLSPRIFLCCDRVDIVRTEILHSIKVKIARLLQAMNKWRLPRRLFFTTMFY